MGFIIILMQRFSRVERSGGENLRHNRVLESFTRLQRGLGCLRLLPLLFIMHKDRRPVRIPPVHKLPALIGRINQLPINIQQPLIREQLRLICNLHGLHMPRRFLTHFLIGRINCVAARITGYHRNNARELVKGLDHTPKAAARKGGKLLCTFRFVQPAHLLSRIVPIIYEYLFFPKKAGLQVDKL
ncbi:hypothetical protein D3C75_933150 [compost metagenome]